MDRRQCLIVTPSLYPHVHTAYGFLIRSLKKLHKDRMIQERLWYPLVRESGKYREGEKSDRGRSTQEKVRKKIEKRGKLGWVCLHCGVF